MCGILGLINFNKDQIFDTLQIQKMNNKVVHRGPNNSGYWHNNQKSIYFAHRRLSILDLSNNGSQPMLSSKKNKVIIYNGEIYNYKEIKNELIYFHAKMNQSMFGPKIDRSVVRTAIHQSIFGPQYIIPLSGQDILINFRSINSSIYFQA